MEKYEETPPPLPDQAVSLLQEPEEVSDRVVPPVPVTYGSLAGKSTEVPPLPASSEPLSPEAAYTDWPCAAASWKSVLSAVRLVLVSPDS